MDSAGVALLQPTHAQFARLTASAPYGRFSMHD